MRKTVVSILLALVAFTTSAFSQDPWSELIERTKNPGLRHAPWILLVQSEASSEPLQQIDPGFRNLIYAGDISLRTLDAEETKEAWKQKGWNEQIHWIFFNIQGTELTVGDGLPSAQEIKVILLKNGHVPRYERMKEFLKLYPDNGPANELNMTLAWRSVAVRFREATAANRATRVQPVDSFQLPIGGTLGSSDIADEVFSEMIPALQQFILNVPDWWRSPTWMGYGGMLRLFDAGKSRRMANIMREMQYEALSEWQKAPKRSIASLESWAEGSAIDWIWGDLSAALGEKINLPSIEPCPSDFFPTGAFVSKVCIRHIESGLHNETITFTDSVLAQLPEPENLNSWHEYAELMFAIWGFRSNAYAALGRKPECFDALENARYWAGDRWNDENQETRINMVEQITRRYPDFFTADEKQMFENNKLVPGDSSKFPTHEYPTLRIIVMNNLEWISEIKPLLQYWTKKEVYVGSPDEKDLELLDALSNQDFSWALIDQNNFIGTESIISTGSNLDVLKTNLQAVLQQRQSLYQRLSRYINRNPQTIEGRIERYNAAKLSYSPESHIEAMLNDALEANIPFEFANSIELSDREINSVRQHIFRVKQVLARWPYASDLWTAIISWNKIAKNRNFIADIIDEMVFFDDPQIWHAKLPKAVHLELIEELTSSNGGRELREWIDITLIGLEELISTEQKYDNELHEMLKKH